MQCAAEPALGTAFAGEEGKTPLSIQLGQGICTYLVNTVICLLL